MARGTGAERWSRFHRIFSLTSVHCEQECRRFSTSVDVATKTPSENAKNHVGSDRSFEGAPNHIFADFTDYPGNLLSDMCGSSPKQQSSVHVSLVSSFPPPLRRGTRACPETDLAILAWWDCTARFLGQEAVLNRWRLSTRFGSDAPLLLFPPKNNIINASTLQDPAVKQRKLTAAGMHAAADFWDVLK